MTASGSKQGARPYDRESLERMALHYVGRYATTRTKLTAYLNRKLREHGWAGEEAPPIDSLVQQFADRGYVNDMLFAQARTGALLRRGYGRNRIEANLRAAGIDGQTSEAVRGDIEAAARQSALAFARRRKIGPFANKPLNHDENRKALAAMLRAGHSFDMARSILRMTEIEDDANADVAYTDFSGNADDGW